MGTSEGVYIERGSLGGKICNGMLEDLDEGFSEVEDEGGPNSLIPDHPVSR